MQLKQGSVQDTTLPPDREQHHSISTKQIRVTPKRASESERCRSLTPPRHPTVKRPMRLLLLKPTKRLLSLPQTRTGFSPAVKRPTVTTPSQPSTHTVHEKGSICVEFSIPCDQPAHSSTGYLGVPENFALSTRRDYDQGIGKFRR